MEKNKKTGADKRIRGKVKKIENGKCVVLSPFGGNVQAEIETVIIIPEEKCLPVPKVGDMVDVTGTISIDPHGFFLKAETLVIENNGTSESTVS